MISSTVDPASRRCHFRHLVGRTIPTCFGRSSPQAWWETYACSGCREYAPYMTQPYHMSKPTEAGLARFAVLLEDLSSERDVVKASMFGMPGIKRRGGKAFCGLYGEDMIFKLADEDHERALGLKGAHLFEPMAGRPMKAWVQVPPEHEGQYADLARSAEASLDS
jgi:hypothetical protein